MATTIHPRPPAMIDRESGRNNQGASRSVGAPGRGRDSSPAARTSVWIGAAAITMTFAALSSAMIIRQASAYDWQRFALPRVLLLDTAVLLASSFTLELARRYVAAYLGQKQGLYCSARICLWLTLALGIVFLGGQCTAWLQLRSQGLYLATNPSTAFFYLLTAIHALHLLGGLVGLGLVVARFNRSHSTLRVSTLNAASNYWHFMDALWIYVLLLLWWRM